MSRARTSGPRRPRDERSSNDKPALPFRPLYREAAALTERAATGHAGLWFDKFCPWKRTASWRAIEASKLECLQEACARPAGDESLLAELITRRKRLIASHDGQAVCVKTAGRFVTGLGYQHPLENGFAWHSTLGAPYLPGSGLKGVTRTWAELTEAPHRDIHRIFGPRTGARSADAAGEDREPQAGSVVFLEAIPRRPVKLAAEVMTPHYSPYYQDGEAPADYHRPNPIQFLTVDHGQPFFGGVLPRDAEAQDDARRAHEWLVTALVEIGAGAKTATGYGRFEIDGAALGEWEAFARELRLARGLVSPLERMRALVSKLSEKQLYEHVTRYLEKGELSDEDDRAAFRRAAREARFFACWQRGQPADPRERPAGDKKLKQAAALLAEKA